jgi:NAD(P)H-flavin reductase
MDNLYKPDLMEVLEVRQHTSDVKSMRVRFRDAERGAAADQAVKPAR